MVVSQEGTGSPSHQPRSTQATEIQPPRNPTGKLSHILQFMHSLHTLSSISPPSSCGELPNSSFPPFPGFHPSSLGLIDSRGTVMLASEISGGSVEAGGCGGTEVLPGGVVATFGSVAGACSSEFRGSGGLGETPWSTGRTLEFWAVVPELLRF